MNNDRKKHLTVPPEYSGKWIAWNHKHTKIIASGNTSGEARQKAKNLGEEESWVGKVPRADSFYTGPALVS